MVIYSDEFHVGCKNFCGRKLTIWNMVIPGDMCQYNSNFECVAIKINRVVIFPFAFMIGGKVPDKQFKKYFSAWYQCMGS